MATTEKMIIQMEKRSREVSVSAGKTPKERFDNLVKKIDLLNKAKVLREVIN